MTELENLEAACGGNPDRAKVILARVRELIRDEQPISCLAIDAACIFLPGWEACTDAEATAAFAVIEAEANAHSAKLEAEAAATKQPEAPAAEPETVVTDTAQDVTVSRDTALANLNAEIKAREAARTALNVAVRKQQELRGKLADLLQVWQTGRPQVSFVQALMEVSATQRLTKQQQMDRTVPGPSAWDRRQFYSAGRGHASAFVEKQMRGGGNHRGSLPMSAARGKMDTAGTSKVVLRRTDTGSAS